MNIGSCSHQVFYAMVLFKFSGNPTNHLERNIPLIAVLVFFIGVDQGKVSGLQGLLLSIFV